MVAGLHNNTCQYGVKMRNTFVAFIQMDGFACMDGRIGF